MPDTKHPLKVAHADRDPVPQGDDIPQGDDVHGLPAGARLTQDGVN
jgi:hypothetical protein